MLSARGFRPLWGVRTRPYGNSGQPSRQFQADFKVITSYRCWESSFSGALQTRLAAAHAGSRKKQGCQLDAKAESASRRPQRALCLPGECAIRALGFFESVVRDRVGTRVSLPGQSFQPLTIKFWFAALSGVGDFVAAASAKIDDPYLNP